MEDKRYTYCIQPRRVIKDLPDVGNIRTPKILQLTKEEVLICMKSGHVFRRFAAESRNERVTSDNLDRLHNDKFMTEKEYKEFLKNSDVVDEEKEEVAADPVVEDNASEEETVETIELEDNAEIKDEAVAIEETTEEALSEDENTTSDEAEISEDVNDEEIVDEDTEDESEDDEIVDNEEEEAEEEVVENHTENNASTLNIQVNNNNYGKKKKKRH